MTSRSKASKAVPVLIWAILVAVVLVFPTILSIYGVLWILLPCLLVYLGFQAGTRFQSVLPKVATVLISGVCEAIATLVFGAVLNGFHHWNIVFDTFAHFMLGLVASSVGLLLSFLVRRVRRGDAAHGQR